MNSKEINAVYDRLRASRPYEVGEHFNEEIEDAWRIYDKGKQEYYDAWSEPDGTTFTSESDREAAVWGVWRAVQAERERFAGIRANDQKIFQHYARSAIKLLLTEERLNCIRAIEQIIGDRRITDSIADSIRVMPWPSNAPSEITASPWRDFRKERPADGQYVHFRCEGEDETEHAWYSEEQRRIKGPMIDIYPDQLSWFLWQPYVEPAPPTSAEIEAAMKGDGNAG